MMTNPGVESNDDSTTKGVFVNKDYLTKTQELGSTTYLTDMYPTANIPHV